jgi:arylsulfatase A-like enzyme
MKFIFFLALSFTVFAADKPNVLFIAVDDLRPELGAFGSPQVKTPHIDKFCESAVVFDRAYCNIPVCGASRASLMTGILPTAKRYITYTSRADVDTPGAKTIPQLFKENGYTSLSFGKIFHNPKDTADASWSEKPWKASFGGAKWLDPESGKKPLSKKGRGRIYELPDVADNAYPDGMVAEKTISELRRLKKEGKPFFLACGFVKPHMPFYAPKKYWDFYVREKVQIADNQYKPKNAPSSLRGSGEFGSYTTGGIKVNSEAWHRMMRHGYLACVSYVDKLIGDVLQEVKDLGLEKNTIVVFWGDHGWHLGEHNFWGKHNTMHPSLRVPLIVRVPGSKGGKCSSLIETVDIFPTLCDLAGLEKPAQLQGRSFVKQIKDPSLEHREYIYSRFGPGDVVLTKEYSLTKYFKKNETMLFDHRKDPDENDNVAGNPDYKPIVEKLLDLMKKEMTRAKSAKW